MIYLALLRGINVGGKNTVPMPELKASFSAAGLDDVRTYINSGNVIFASAEQDKSRLVTICAQAMERRLGFVVPIALIEAKALHKELAQAPPWWGADPAAKHNAIFVIAPATAQEIAAQVGNIKPQYEQVHIGQEIILWSAAIATFSRTSWLKLNSIEAYQYVTIRNANTARKLAALTLAAD